MLAFCGLGALLLSVSRGETYKWSWPILALGVAALVLLSWFVVVEKRSSEPMLDLELFRIRAFAAGNLAALLNFMTQYVIVFLTPFLLQQAMGLSAGRAGATMTAFPLTVLVLAPLAGALSDRIGQRGLAFTGSLICTIAALLLAGLGQQAASGDVAWRLSLFGLGTGLFQSPNNARLFEAHAGRYVAVVGQQVVDADDDFAHLAHRVFARFGSRPVFMPKVTPAARAVRVLSPRVVRS